MDLDTPEINLECLPEELVIEIAEKLSPEDLLACSEVCIAWRNLFNKDLIWKKVYNVIFPMSDPLELEDRPSVVNGGFKIPENKSDEIEDLCEWRVYCLREVRLRNNWANGCYHNTSRAIKFNRFEGDDVCCDEEMFIYNEQNYDLNNDLALVKFTELRNGNYDFIRFFRNKIFTRKNRKIRTYTVNSKKILFFESEFDFDKSERNHKPISNTAPIYCLFIKQLFVGSIKGSNFFHLWDLEKIKKIAEQPLPLLGCEIDVVNYRFENDRIYVQVDLTSSYLKKDKLCSRKLFVFDINKLHLKEIDIDMDYQYIYFSKNYILTIGYAFTKFTVWADTGELETVIRTRLSEESFMFVYPYLTLAENSDVRIKIHNVADPLVHKSIRFKHVGGLFLSGVSEIPNIAAVMVHQSDKLVLLFYNFITDRTVLELSTDKSYVLIYHSKLKLVFLSLINKIVEVFNFW